MIPRLGRLIFSCASFAPVLKLYLLLWSSPVLFLLRYFVHRQANFLHIDSYQENKVLKNNFKDKEDEEEDVAEKRKGEAYRNPQGFL